MENHEQRYGANKLTSSNSGVRTVRPIFQEIVEEVCKIRLNYSKTGWKLVEMLVSTINCQEFLKKSRPFSCLQIWYSFNYVNVFFLTGICNSHLTWSKFTNLFCPIILTSFCSSLIYLSSLYEGSCSADQFRYLFPKHR